MGRQLISCVTFAGRSPTGCVLVVRRSLIRCVMVARRSPIGCVLVVGMSFHDVISQRCHNGNGSLYNDVVATSLHNVITIKT